MKRNTFRKAIGGSVAAVLALSISLPLQANAADSNSGAAAANNGFTQFLQSINSYSIKTLHFSGGSIAKGQIYYFKKPVVTAAPVATPAATAQPAATAKPVATPAATAKPVATPAATAKPVATPAATAKPVATAAPAADSTQASFVKQVVTLVNKERAAAGLSPVTALDSLNKVAAAKATDMRVNNYFSHTSPTYGSPFDMMKSFGVTYRAAGENIAMGQKTPEAVMTAWMNSEGHRANILSPNFNYIGVGFDNYYWVQEFIGK
ncbi:CAP domain-containing protein [Paenibacillus tepidiphilus]|uniref:CAP domain-containing protein n=1 Tax=Paenibacillus tepidiphilus TaxID=2608683 RepID=UPI0012394B21|nr:CAP domain-containing protein [Paenibacillus tepidiphilus]